MSSSSNQVIVLLFLDLTTTSGATKKAQVNGARLRVTMKKVGGQWLVSGLQPV